MLEDHGFRSRGAQSREGEGTLARGDARTRTAVVLGAEGPGLAADLLARAKTVRIPMADGFDSLNVAVTAGVVLHHLAFAARRGS
jgi:tRNA G18 (ribose-2'-O)-methylase SpoU